MPFNKERYVNAQYRFLVKPTGDYTAYFADSDIYLNWADILTVLIPTTSALSSASHMNALPASLQQPSLELHEGATCPICLSPPTAPRMTKCGHVFCFPCILHYLTLQETASQSGSSTPTPYHHHLPGAHRNTPLTTLSNAPPATPPKWKRCPICWDAVYAKDLKAVEWWDAKARAQEFEQMNESQAAKATDGRDNQLCMRLIERPHLTTLALPQSSTWPYASTSTSDQPLIAQHSAPWHFQPDVMTFCKFMLATPDQLLANLNSNLSELEEEKQLLQSFGMKDEEGLYFIGLAERKVQEQVEKVLNELDITSVQSRIGYAKNELKEHAEVEQGIKERSEEALSKREKRRRERERRTDSGNEVADKEEAGAAVEFLQLQAQKQGGAMLERATDEHDDNEPLESNRKDGRTGTTRTRRNLNPPAPSSSSYFFFQASSGQNIFLHPLDIKVLLSLYGSYAAFPKTLQVYVQGADEGSMNEEIKRKCKYLTHLTKGTDIVFVEVDWDIMAKDKEAHNDGLRVDPQVMRVYEQALKQRRNRRKDRERREDRAKLKWEEKEKAGRPIGVQSPQARESYSPTFSASEELFPSSLGSTSAPSPSFREAALVGAEQQFPMHPGMPLGSDEEFPATSVERRKPVTGGARDIVPAGGKKKTVWGTPAAQSGSFANALHNSSRQEAELAKDDKPDWDAWLELEEDYIVGARNGTSMREGKGLNRQVKKGSTNGATGEAVTPSPKSELVPGVAASMAPTSKQQKKKKLVLTSGGGGRGR